MTADETEITTSGWFPHLIEADKPDEPNDDGELETTGWFAFARKDGSDDGYDDDAA